LSSLVTITHEQGTYAVSAASWAEFCGEHAITFSPHTVGRNTFYANGVEITFGEPDYGEPPRLDDGGIDWSAITPPHETAYRLWFSTTDSPKSAVTLAVIAWKLWGGDLSMSPELAGWVTVADEYDERAWRRIKLGNGAVFGK
jgi:hypothetical protein